MTIAPGILAFVVCAVLIVAAFAAFWAFCLYLDCRNFESSRDWWKQQAEANGKALSDLREKLAKLSRGE